MRNSVLGCVLFAMTGPAHAADYRLDFKPSPEQSTRMDQGRETIISKQANSVIFLSELPGVTKPYAKFQVMVLNTGTQPLNFGPENGRLVYRPDGSFITLRRYEQVAAAEKRTAKKRRTAAILLSSLGAAFSGAAAGNYSGSGTFTTGRQMGTFTYSGRDPVAEQLALNRSAGQTQELVVEFDARQAAKMRASQGMVQTTTIDPGQAYGGLMMVSGPKEREKEKAPYPVSIEIRFGSDLHRFEGMLQRK